MTLKLFIADSFVFFHTAVVQRFSFKCKNIKIYSLEVNVKIICV